MGDKLYMATLLTDLKFLGYKHQLMPNPPMFTLGLKKEKLKEGESCRVGKLEKEKVVGLGSWNIRRLNRKKRESIKKI